MAFITAETRSDIVELAMGMLNQAPSTALLGDLISKAAAGSSLLDLANHIATTDAFVAQYPATQTAREFATEMFDKLITGGTLDSAIHAQVIDILEGLLTAGTTKAEGFIAVIEFLGNPTSALHPDLGDIAKAFQNRAEVAEYYSVTMEKGGAGEAERTDVIAGVTSDNATVEAAKSAIWESSDTVSQQTFTLTTSVPSISKEFIWSNIDLTGSPIAGLTSATSTAIELLAAAAEEYDALIDETVEFTYARLTPSGDVVNVVEGNNTTLNNDLIVAGTAQALHGAYINGGAGYNTLEVEMKGPFAQPVQLLNIQAVNIHNTTNYYSDDLFAFDNVERDSLAANLNDVLGDEAGIDVNDFINGVAGTSVIDLSNARQIESVNVTDSGADNDLVVLGVRNYADLKLEGGFSGDVTVHYGAGQSSALNVEMVNVDFSEGGAFHLAHNAGHVILKSSGYSNILDDVHFGAQFQKLTVTGSGILSLQDDLNFAFGVAEIDASANTGGTNFSLADASTEGGLTEIHIMGSSAKDVVTISGTQDGALMAIDLGAGLTNKLTFDGNVDAGAGSSIAGSNLTIVIDGAGTAQLDLADIESSAEIKIDAGATLTLTNAQVDSIGTDDIGPLHRTGGTLNVLLSSDTDYGATSLATLDDTLTLALELADDVNLDITAADLDTLNSVDASSASNGSSITISGLTVNSQISAAAINNVTNVQTLNVVVDGLSPTADDAFSVTDDNAADQLVVLHVHGDTDLSAATLTGVEKIVLADGASLVLTAAQVETLEANVADADGTSLHDVITIADGDSATLSVVGYTGQDTDYGDLDGTGVTVSSVAISAAAGAVTIDGDFTGVGAIVTTAATNVVSISETLFDGLTGAGTISGPGTVNVTGLGNNTDVDLSAVTAVNGTITLAVNDVTVGATADLNSFSITLTDSSDASNGAAADELAGQNIRFSTQAQAERTVTVSGAADGDASTSVIWLFDTITGAVDASGYDADLARLWMHQDLVGGANIEALADQLSGAITVRVYNDNELLSLSSNTDRVLEIEAFTELESLTFNDVDADAPFFHVENLSIVMGGASNIGDISIDNIVSDSVINDTPFNTLTITSELANNDNHYLLPEGWDADTDARPDSLPAASQVNTVGDISSGANRGDLSNVTLTTSGVGLVVGTITLDSPDAATTAALTVSGNQDVTIESVVSTDADITALTVTVGAGDLEITGASPAISLAAAATITINIGGAGGLTLGTATDATGISAAGLTALTTAGAGAGAVALGVIEDVDGDEFTLTEGHAGTVTATIGADTLNAEGTWTFSGAGLTVTLSEDATLTAGGTLTMAATAVLDISGDVDLTGVTTTLGTVTVGAGDSLTLTAAQANGLTVTGAGSVIITALEDTLAADLSGIFTSAGDTGSVAATLDTTDGDLAFTGNAGVATITVTGDNTLDATGATTAPVDRNGTATAGDTSDDTLPAFVVAAGATLAITASQAGNATGADATSWTMSVTGEGTTTVEDLALNADADLSGIASTTVTAVTNDVTFTGDLGTATVTVNDTQTLTAAASVLDGVTIIEADATDGVVAVTGDATDVDLSNISVDAINIAAAATVENTTFPTTIEGQTITLSSVQADGETIGGVGAVTINVDETDADAFDLSGVTATTTTVAFDADYTLDADTDLGTAAITVAAGDTLTAAGGQVSGLTATGAGNLTLTNVALADDLTNIAVAGTVTINALGAEFTIDAVNADGVVFADADDQAAGIDTDDDGAAGPDVALTDITVTNFEDATDGDLTTFGAYTVSVELDSTGDVSIANGGDIDDYTVTISGNGTVTVADESAAAAADATDVASASFVIGADATLVSDAGAADTDAIVTIANVSGAGTFSLIAADTGAYTLEDTTAALGADNTYDGARFTTVTVNAGDAGITLTNFAAGAFTYSSVGLVNTLGVQVLSLDTSGVEIDDESGGLGIERAATGTITDTTGILIYEANDSVTLDAAAVEDIFDGSLASTINMAFANQTVVGGGDGDDDQLYIVFSNGTDTAIALITDNDEDGEFVAANDSFTLVVTLLGVTDASDLLDSQFAGFGL